MVIWDSFGLELPAVEVLDWPDYPIRGLKEECRYGSNMMEKQDWIALLKIYDITQTGGDQKKIAPIAKARKEARLALMLCCEQTKEDWVCKAATMRNHSVFMQTFADIENYISSTETPQLDLMDITPIMSKENFMLR